MPRTAKVNKEGNYLIAVEEVNARFERIRAGLVARRIPDGANYDPLVELAAMANDLNLPDRMRMSLHGEVAEYLYPKVRNLEVSNPQNQQVKVIIEIAPYARLEEKSVEVEFHASGEQGSSEGKQVSEQPNSETAESVQQEYSQSDDERTGRSNEQFVAVRPTQASHQANGRPKVRIITTI